jgi:RHS repeat-associated protein
MADGWIVASYNALNQPVAIGNIGYGSNYMWFWYDPLGRCVKRWKGDGNQQPVGTPATYYYYDGWNLVQEGPSGASADRTYVHGARVDEIVASQAGGSWCYHHYDARGHCILLTNAVGGGIREQYDYDAFGTPYFYSAGGTRTTYSSFGNRFLFTGREWMQDLKLYDFRNRIYQPEMGRFLQPDPKEFGAGDYNLYRYCHNDPVNKSDPTGLLETKQVTTVVPILGSHIPFVTTLTVNFTTPTGNYTDSTASNHLVRPGSLGTNKWGNPLEGRTDTTLSTAKHGNTIDANLKINYWITDLRHNDLERQHAFGAEGLPTRGLLTWWGEERSNFASGISGLSVGPWFTPEKRLRSQLSSDLDKIKGEQILTMDCRVCDHNK